MSTSPVSPEDIRAAAEAHHELGPEYSDAVVASFIDKVEREVAARVEARLAAAASAPVARQAGRRPLHQDAWPDPTLTRRPRPHPMLTGVAIGACAGALISVAAISHLDAAAGQLRHAPAPVFAPGTDIRLLPYLEPGVRVVHPRSVTPRSAQAGG